MGDPNLEFIRSAFPVLQNYLSQLLAFFSHAPDFHAYVEWAMDLLGESRRGVRRRVDHVPNGRTLSSGPPQPGTCSVARLVPQRLHRAGARSRLVEASGPQRIISGVNAIGAAEAIPTGAIDPEPGRLSARLLQGRRVISGCRIGRGRPRGERRPSREV